MKTENLIKIDPSTLPALRAAHETIAALVKYLSGVDAVLAAMRQDHGDYTAELLHLEETTSYKDLSGVGKIHAKRGRLELLARQIVTVADSIPPRTDELAEKLRTLNVLVSRAVRPALAALKSELTEALRPAYGSDRNALEMAVNQSPKLISFTNFFHQNWMPAGLDPASYASRALAVLNSLIGGNNPWVFPAE